MGGIGKTVLATALCRDLVVQRAFPDGIAWITIGREWDGDFVTRMREVARALGDDLSGYDNPLACENRYRTILREKAALVVVDDVWNLEHLQPLLVDAPRSRFLFTTRDTGIARAVTDRRFSANLLSESEARDLWREGPEWRWTRCHAKRTGSFKLAESWPRPWHKWAPAFRMCLRTSGAIRSKRWNEPISAASKTGCRAGKRASSKAWR